MFLPGKLNLDINEHRKVYLEFFFCIIALKIVTILVITKLLKIDFFLFVDEIFMPQYIRYTEALLSFSGASFSEKLRTTLPGYPWLIIALGYFTNLKLTALAISITSAFCVIIVIYKLTKDIWLCRYMYFLTPSWFLYSMTNTKESLVLLLQLLVILFLYKKQYKLSFLSLSYMAVVAPHVATVSAISLLLVGVIKKRYDLLLSFILITPIFFILWMVLYYILFDDPLHFFNAFKDLNARDTGLFSIPFLPVYQFIFDTSPLWKKLYIVLHIVISVAAVIKLIANLKSERSNENVFLLSWIVLSLVLFLSYGPDMKDIYESGYAHTVHGFDRRFLHIMPAVFYVFRKYLIKSWYLVSCFYIMSFAMAVFGTVSMIHWYNLLISN